MTTQLEQDAITLIDIVNNSTLEDQLLNVINFLDERDNREEE